MKGRLRSVGRHCSPKLVCVGAGFEKRARRPEEAQSHRDEHDDRRDGGANQQAHGAEQRPKGHQSGSIVVAASHLRRHRQVRRGEDRVTGREHQQDTAVPDDRGVLAGERWHVEQQPRGKSRDDRTEQQIGSSAPYPCARLVARVAHQRIRHRVVDLADEDQRTGQHRLDAEYRRHEEDQVDARDPDQGCRAVGANTECNA
jgi:hypothetical protein